MPPKPIGDHAMTPLERQRRRRERLRAERDAAARVVRAEFLAQCHTPELDRCRHNLGTAASYLASLGDPTLLAHRLVEQDGPLPPWPVLKRLRPGWTDFATAYRYAAALNRL